MARRTGVMKRTDILNRIDTLLNHSCKGECDCSQQIQKLGRLLHKPRKRKTELLTKGQDMKLSELEELRMMEVPWEEIAKAMKFSKSHLEKLFGGMKMAHVNLEKAKELLANTDKTYKEISEETGIKEGTVGYHGKKIRGNQKAVQTNNAPTKTKDTTKHEKAVQDDLQAKYNHLSEQSAKLHEENNRLHKQLQDMSIELEDAKNNKAVMETEMKQAENAIDPYKSMLRERNRDCDVLEDEYSKLRTAYDKLKEWIKADMDVV